METARIADIAEINPRVPRELIDSPEREVNFVPMSHLSERGEITCNGTRPVREVLKGYTYFANGDVIVALNGKPVDSVARLLALLDDCRPGESVQLTVWRDGKEFRVSVTLRSGEDDN